MSILIGILQEYFFKQNQIAIKHSTSTEKIKDQCRNKGNSQTYHKLLKQHTQNIFQELVLILGQFCLFLSHTSQFNQLQQLTKSHENYQKGNLMLALSIMQTSWKWNHRLTRQVKRQRQTQSYSQLKLQISYNAKPFCNQQSS